MQTFQMLTFKYRGLTFRDDTEQSTVHFFAEENGATHGHCAGCARYSDKRTREQACEVALGHANSLLVKTGSKIIEMHEEG